MNSVVRYIQEHRRELTQRYVSIPEQMSCAVITPRFRASRHVIFLVLSQQTADPILVAKLARLPGDCEPSEREANNLRAAHAVRPEGFGSIPQLLACDQNCGHSILLETALTGRPIAPATLRRHFAPTVSKVFEWLTDFHLAHRTSASSGTQRFESLVDQPLNRLSHCLETSAEETQFMNRTWELADHLKQRSIPLVFEHGDLSHPNLLFLHEGSVGVLDWELAVPHGLPACDLFFFLTYAAFSLRDANTIEQQVAAFDEAFFGPEAWGLPIIQDYAQRLNLPDDALRPLFAICWARYAARISQRLHGSPGETPLQRETLHWIRNHRYTALWKHTLEHWERLDW